MSQMGPTFAQMDQLEADRQNAADVLRGWRRFSSREFSLNELRFVQIDHGGAILIESFEIARSGAGGESHGYPSQDPAGSEEADHHPASGEEGPGWMATPETEVDLGDA